MRVMMIIASAASYFVNDLFAKSRYANANEMNFETPLTSLVWITSIVSVILTFAVSKLTIPELGGDTTLWWKLAIIISAGRSQAQSFPSSSRSSPPLDRGTSRRWSLPREKAVLR